MSAIKDFSESVIDLKDISKSYPGLKALSGISFSVKKGSIHGFLGPNGAGTIVTGKQNLSPK